MGDNQAKPSGYTEDALGNQVPYFKENVPSPGSNVVSSENQTINQSNAIANPAAIPSASATDAPPSYEAAVADVNAAPVVVAAAPPAPVSNEINVAIVATIEPNKHATIREVASSSHFLQFEPAIDLVNPTEALNRLSYGINQTINAKAGDLARRLQEDYVAPAPKPTYGQRAKTALKSVSGFLTRKNKVAPEPVAVDNSVRNVMQPRVGGRRMNTKKNRKRRITRSNRKRARPSRRR